MTINLETDVVGSGTDSKSGEYVYTLARNGRRWAVRMPADWTAKTHDANQRRAELEAAFERAMCAPGAPGQAGDAELLERLARGPRGCILDELNGAGN